MAGQGEIVVFFTGGTIGMGPADQGPGVAPGGNFGRIAAESFPGQGLAAIRLVEWSDKPSPHMTPACMRALTLDIDAALASPNTLGAVVLHGTDTLVESAYLCDLLLANRKPVIFTGSMRYYTESGYDGLRNLCNAIRAIPALQSEGTGAAVLMTDRIFAARDAVKVNSLNVDAFESRENGLIAHVAGEDVVLLGRARSLAPGPRFPGGAIEEGVHLATCYTGMAPTILAHLRREGMAGLVLEGFGAGNVPPSILGEIDACVQANIPVVVATRCIEGGVWPIYGYPGGGADLAARGAILCGRLGGPKARLLLMCALGGAHGLDEIRQFFQ